jgi:hypothetical protein
MDREDTEILVYSCLQSRVSTFYGGWKARVGITIQWASSSGGRCRNPCEEEIRAKKKVESVAEQAIPAWRLYTVLKS